MIKVNNLTFYYPGKRALEDISFSIEAGSITALVGPNGAGKSTLLRCIAGLDTPMLGSIYVNSLDVLKEPRKAHTYMGYLPDFYGLYDALTVKQCLLYYAKVQNIPKSDCLARIMKVAKQLQIEDYLEREAGTLSRGQRQRLAIAQAIIHHPKVLLLDEPAAGLDPEARTELSILLRTLAEEGITLIVSSHILSELEDYCSQMMIIRNGCLIKHCGVSNETNPIKRIRVLFLQFSTQFLEILQKIPKINHIKQQDELTVEFDYEGNKKAQSQLLATLISLSLPIYSFYELEENLSSIYLKTTQASEKITRTTSIETIHT